VTKEELVQSASRLLREAGKKIAFAESFTGGTLISSFIAFAGASEIVTEGIVAYTDTAKAARLNIDKKILSEYSAVSAETAAEMAQNLLSTSEADLCVSTTGYAGHSGENVGECYIALASRKKVDVHKYNFSGGRDKVIAQGVESALNLIIRALCVDTEFENYF